MLTSKITNNIVVHKKLYNVAYDTAHNPVSDSWFCQVNFFHNKPGCNQGYSVTDPELPMYIETRNPS